MTAADRFDPRRIVEVLDRHRVEYVLVGGYAAQLYGSRRPTYDLDVTPSVTPDNLARLSSALRELHAGIRVDHEPEGLPFDCTGESLRGMLMLNLRTAAGDLDLTFFPSGFPDGYEGLLPGAQERMISGIVVNVAGLDDVIKSKVAAARAKDLDALPELIEIAEHDRNRGHDNGLEL
ncbi:hypothetical protein [Mycobacterium sp.]|uniref:hypothetical protein n=1 Tax=Mycobacterium sp. TaxID=1785 RepID=UPI003A8730D5